MTINIASFSSVFFFSDVSKIEKGKKGNRNEAFLRNFDEEFLETLSGSTGRHYF